MPKKTLVLGASANPSRYSFLAIQKLRSHGHSVLAVGRKKGKVADVELDTDHKMYEDIDTVTLYLNPTNQKGFYNYIVSLKPARIIFNPGTENDELYELAKKHGIRAEQACTLVLLSTGQY